MSAQPAGSASGPVFAPSAPGRLGEAASVPALSAFLEALADWVRRRKQELDRIDAAALRSTDPDDYTSDVLLSMALWQSVNDRQAALLRSWDSGRADVQARERMSQLIWGRLDGGPQIGPTPAGPGGGLGAAAGAGSLSLSLVEACRLSDALATQLATRLAFDPSAADAPARVAALRDALERMRELVKQEPSWSPQVSAIEVRVNDVATRAARGAGVDDVLKQIETDAARAERDLIVTTATRQEAARERVRAVERQARERVESAQQLARDQLEATRQLAAINAREQAARALVERCVAQIAHPPRFAVPEPDVLGPVPTGRDELDAYLARLAQVSRAMEVVERAYAAPLAERDELRGRLDAYRVMATRTGRDGDPATAEVLRRARVALAAVPCDVPAASALVEQYTRLVRPAGGPGPTTGASTGTGTAVGETR